MKKIKRINFSDEKYFEMRNSFWSEKKLGKFSWLKTFCDENLFAIIKI